MSIDARINISGFDLFDVVSYTIQGSELNGKNTTFSQPGSCWMPNETYDVIEAAHKQNKKKSRYGNFLLCAKSRQSKETIIARLVFDNKNNVDGAFFFNYNLFDECASYGGGKTIALILREKDFKTMIPTSGKQFDYNKKRSRMYMYEKEGQTINGYYTHKERISKTKVPIYKKGRKKKK